MNVIKLAENDPKTRLRPKRPAESVCAHNKVGVVGMYAAVNALGRVGHCRTAPQGTVSDHQSAVVFLSGSR